MKHPKTHSWPQEKLNTKYKHVIILLVTIWSLFYKYFLCIILFNTLSNLGDNYYYDLHIIEEETQVSRGEINYPEPLNIPISFYSTAYLFYNKQLHLFSSEVCGQVIGVGLVGSVLPLTLLGSHTPHLIVSDQTIGYWAMHMAVPGSQRQDSPSAQASACVTKQMTCQSQMQGVKKQTLIFDWRSCIVTVWRGIEGFLAALKSLSQSQPLSRFWQVIEPAFVQISKSKSLILILQCLSKVDSFKVFKMTVPLFEGYLTSLLF